jgi:YVTN family beta-propeller protein
MRFAQAAARLITVAISGLAPITTAATVPASSVQGTAHGAKGCITVSGTISIKHSTLGAAVNSKTNTIYVANILGTTVSVISGRTNTVTATIPVGNYPQDIAADPKTNTVYVANTNDNTVSVISTRTNTVTATIPMASPGAFAVDPKTDTAYVAASSYTVSVLTPCPK